MNRGIIKNVEVKVLELPLKKQWKISLYEQTTRAHAVVRITTEDGIVGFGEAAPSPAFMGETGYTMVYLYLENVYNILIRKFVRK